MNPFLILGLAFSIVGVGVVAMLLLRGQKNVVLLYDPDTGHFQPKRRRTMSGSLRIRRADKTFVRCILHPEYSKPRMDGKGSVLVVDIKSGQPMMPKPDGSWVSLDGIYLELAYADDTIQKIRKGTGGGMDMLKILAVLAVGNLVGIVIIVYQFAKAGGIS